MNSMAERKSWLRGIHGVDEEAVLSLNRLGPELAEGTQSREKGGPKHRTDAEFLPKTLLTSGGNVPSCTDSFLQGGTKPSGLETSF